MIEIKKDSVSVKEKKVLGYYTSEVVKFGNSAKINCQKKYIGKKVLVVLLDEDAKE
jgi:putative transposon-encoded protein